MPTIRTRDMSEKETEVTPDLCFSRAAEALTGSHTTQFGGHDIAREWRELGLALLHAQQTTTEGA